jgi:hypothetical protein
VVLKQKLPAGGRTYDTELAKDLPRWLPTVACCLSGRWSRGLRRESVRRFHPDGGRAITGVGAQLSISRR